MPPTDSVLYRRVALMNGDSRVAASPAVLVPSASNLRRFATFAGESGRNHCEVQA